MIHAYDQLYLSKASRAVGNMLHDAVLEYGLEGADFLKRGGKGNGRERGAVLEGHSADEFYPLGDLDAFKGGAGKKGGACNALKAFREADLL